MYVRHNRLLEYINVSGARKLNQPRGKILYFVTEDWYFCSHRLPLAVAAKNAGYEVVVVTRVREHGEIIRSAGLKLIPLELDRTARGLLSQFKTVFNLVGIYKKEKPDIVHHVAMMPVIYGSLAAKLTRVPAVVNALTGLGYVFISSRIKARVIKFFISIAFRYLLRGHHYRTIFQNPDDRDLFCSSGIIEKKNTILIRGSGVDTDRFFSSNVNNQMPVVMLASRMLWDKGVGEFVGAVRNLQSEGVKARFLLVGDGDLGNRNAVPVEQLKKWHDEKIIEWLGRCKNMVDIFSNVDIVCLPSYREGVPLVLIEAAACGKPIVTTDVPGCREIVRHNENGILIPQKNIEALTSALRGLIVDKSLRIKMGEKGREIACNEFSVGHVIDATLEVYKTLER